MSSIKKIVVLFLVWRVALFFLSFFADTFLLYAPSFPYADGLLDTFSLPRWLYSWANFDGVHYLFIAQQGYHSADLIQAFFPTFPYLIQAVNFLFDAVFSTENHLIASLLISNIAFVCALLLFYKLVRREYSVKTATLSISALLLFPTSFFFVGAYTESLFLLLVLATFWFSKQKKYWLVAIFIFFASSTRITGIFLIPAVFFEILFPTLQLQKFSLSSLKDAVLKHSKSLATVSLGSLGLFAYMTYLYFNFNDPLYFFHVQEEFGGGVRQESLITYPQVVWRYLKILVTARPFDLKYLSYVQEFVVGIVGLVVLLYNAKKIPLSYTIFSLCAFLLPTLTGTFSSMPRYILVCFPIFITIAHYSQRSALFKYSWFLLSGFLLLLNTLLFIQGYWVA